MATEIPKFDIAAYTQQITLGGNVYRIEFKYNSRDDSWLMDIQRRDGTPLVNGRKVVVDFPLFNRFGYNPEMPLGEIMENERTKSGLEPSRETFVEEFAMLFLTDAEIAEL